MTPEERRAVLGVYAFGCRAELPGGIHISLNLLSRMTKMPEVQLLDGLRAVRSLNFKAVLRDEPHPAEPNVLFQGEKDIQLDFWSPAVPQSKDTNRVVYWTVTCAAKHFCEDHGLELLTRLDFHRLSSTASGPLIFDGEDQPEHDHD